jgi:hypothetical protein
MAKRGRPPKVRPPSNVADFDLDRLRVLQKAALRAILGQRAGAKLAPRAREELANALAYELAFIPAAQGVATTLSTGKPGPKPKFAEGVFMAQVAEVLSGFGIQPREWDGGSGSRSELSAWCRALLREAGVRGIHFSARTSARVIRDRRNRPDK